jgi:DNA-binding ferritin-like protein
MSLNIIIDADVQSATQKIGKFVYTMKKDFQEVEKTVRKTSTTVKESTDKMAEAANSLGKSSRNSLTALSLTLQDLPFGFIGIQNNLPGIIQGFGQMSMEAKTGASVMTQLKTALMGPAGLFLAFSAVTAIVTKLSMEYGGLGNAIDAIFGKINPLSKVIKDAAKSQEDFNESFKTSGQIIASATGSVDAQILKVKLLSETVKNLSNSEELRKNALYELQKIDKAYFGQITTAIGDVGKLEEATRKYTDAILANAIAKAYEGKVTEAAINLEEQKNLLKELAPAYTEATKKQKEFLDSYQGAFDPVTGAELVQPSFIATPDIENFKKQQLVVNAAVTTLNKLKESFKNATLEATKFVEPVEKAAKAVKKIKLPKELDLEELSRKARRAANKLQEQADKNRLKYLADQLKLEEKITKETFAQADKQMKADAEEFTKVNFKNLEKVTKPLADLQKKLEEAKFLLNEVFFNPLQDAFMNLFETGKFAFKAFGDAVLKQIQQLVSKIIATGIISLISNLLFPGVGVAAGGASLFAKIGADILGAIGLGGGVANPSFGGVGPGSMGMSGQVNVVLRGSDLVGALNRTNATINRVG